jgi:hypothetical protein
MTTATAIAISINTSPKTNTTTITSASKNFHNTQYHNKNDAAVDFKYICIKKDCFDVNMIDYSYANLNKNKYIEIIYKSPSVFLEGLYLKTPAIISSDIDIFYKNRQTNNITIKISLNHQEHSHFINILRSIDEKTSAYFNKSGKDIETELNTNCDDQRPVSLFRYEPIIKYRYNNIIEFHMKSYLDRNTISMLEQKHIGKIYMLTFNISNIYFGISNLVPLVKCNRCETC